ncbi:MAG TPA: hypothetical protein VM580_24425 [Labilithrix sp.]|nr:hypothetical protein [Labilithrix sp.]
MPITPTSEMCLTCYGTGETATESGPLTCADCFGEGRAVGQGAKLEWRLRELERVHRKAGGEAAPDIIWLVHELRRSRDALLRILARCQDADEADTIAGEIRFQVNEVLGIYTHE